MSPGTLPLDGIRARISTIETRFESPRRETMSVADAEQFDPFGEAYLAALGARNAPPGSSASIGAIAFGPTPRGTDNRLSSASTSSGRASSDPRVAAAIGGVASTGGPRPVGGYGSMPVPSELQVYGNGRIPAERLSPIAQNGHRLYAPAAAAWDSVVSAASADGIDLRITDSNRSYDQQVDLAARKGLYRNGGLAATPGTSNHGWGLAVDVDVLDPRTLEWMRANGPRFGWVESVPREAWHWEFRPHQV